MMTEWKRFKRMLALYMCQAERYTLTVWPGGDDNILMCVSSGDFDLAIPKEDETSAEQQRTKPIKAVNVEYVTPQELEARLENKSIQIARLDAVTKASIPEVDMPGLLDCFLPKVGDRRALSYRPDFPDQLFTEFAKSWHDAIRQIGIPRTQVLPMNEPRYNPGGVTYQDHYHVSEAQLRSDGYSYFLSRMFPGTAVTTSRNYLQCRDPLKQFPVDNLWMTRALLELVPVHMYQSLIFGEHSYVIRGSGDLWSSMIYAPYNDNASGATRMLELHTRYLPLVIKYDGPCGIASYINRENANIILERGQWKQRNIGLYLSSLPTGLKCCAANLIGIKLDEIIVEYSSQLEGLKMPYAASTIYQKLLDQHQNDALSTIIGNPWEDD